MRLRYLHLQNVPPLKDICITFGKDEILKDRAYAIHFVVGVNGTGKSRLLQAITEVFLALEQQTLHPFPVTLAYDLGEGTYARTIYLYHPNKKSVPTKLIEFKSVLPQDTRWEKMEDNHEYGYDKDYKDEDNKDAKEDEFSLPAKQRELKITENILSGSGTIGSFLPNVILVYTSGSPDVWLNLFEPSHTDLSDYIAEMYDQSMELEERPMGWNDLQERLYRGEQATIQQQQAEEAQRTSLIGGMTETSDIGMFVAHDDLKLAFCAVALHQAIQDFRHISNEEKEENFLESINDAVRNNIRQEGLRGIFNEVGWLWPITISLRLAFHPEQLTQEQATQLTKLYHSATKVVREPEPSTRRLLVFDLQSPDRIDSSRLTAETLFEAIGGETAKIFDVFHTLMRWKQEGLLLDIAITLKKRNVDDLLLYDWLSDGERLFLSRIALFHVLQGQQDALIILDEPETHFNDYWKREIVDIIHNSLKNDSSEIVISTHSSIALTDAFREEIIALYQDKETGKTEAADRIPIPTFGADPGDIMVDVFHTEDRHGKRAIEYLKSRIQHEWKKEEQPELEKLIRAIGAGYYRSELRLKWRELNAS